MRAQSRRRRAASGLSFQTDEAGRRVTSSDLPASPPPQTITATLPPHLGWESQPISQHLRRIQPRPEARISTPPPTPPTPRPPTPNQRQEDRVTLYPDLGLAMLRQGLVGPGRIWMLLRHLDYTGQGWLSLTEARRHLTKPNAPWRVCGWRQLRNLLAQGDGIFWQRRNERIWMRSVPKTAASLGVSALTTPAVFLPASHLRQKIGSVRAHFYASFHSSRAKTCRSGRTQAAPIARITLEKLSLVTRHTQRRYEKTAGIKRQTNIAVGVPPTPIDEQARASQHGHALFHFRDHRGKMGQAGKDYLAWQLPNSYIGPHARRSPGQRRRLNRQLAVLLHEGMTGNDKVKSEKRRNRSHQRFYRDGSQAVRRYNQAPTQDAYWSDPLRHRGTVTFWHVLSKQPAD